MFYRMAIGVLALSTMATVDIGGARAEDGKYPNWKGEWIAVVPRTPGQQLRFDPTKPYGKRQEAPLTAEYQKIYQENLEEQARGGQGLFLDHAACLPAGMPTMMSIGTIRIHHHAGNHLCLRRHRFAPDFHRWSPVACRPRAHLSGLFHGQVDRRGWQRHL